MSKALSMALKQHLAGEVTTVCTCWRIVRGDGYVFRFTDHDEDVVVDGQTFEASTGMLTSSLSANRSMSVDQMDAYCFIDSENVSEADVAAGLFDGAVVDIFQVNWADPSMGVMWLCKGWVMGNVTVNDSAFSVELRGKVQRLDQMMGKIYSPGCQAEFCDALCGLSAGDHTVEDCVVTAVDSRRQFTTSTFPIPETAWDGGYVVWDEPDSGDSYPGLNGSLKMDVIRSGADGVVRLFLPMTYEIHVGDRFSVVSGCDHSAETCHSRFGNIIDFRGHPHIDPEGSLRITRNPDRDGRSAWTR